ncbi:MAG: hypothetical protein K6T92_02040 [Candidatus Rokubacteria bacterium]|nr:hypothetical protein [Candidatus Rokubacteria bacterium]
MRRPVLVLALAVLAATACTSPEATRQRGGGPGADPGNRGQVVLMHEGSRPYHDTPRLIEPYGYTDLEAGRQAHRLGLKEPGARR